jgi:outer membrane biogenesis lipoprotein LolB
MEVLVMKAVRFTLALFVVLALASCALEPTWSIDANWQQVDGDETIQFYKNGTFNMVKGSSSLIANYKFVDTEHIQIDLGSLGTLLMKVSVARNTLTLTNPNGLETKYRRKN